MSYKELLISQRNRVAAHRRLLYAVESKEFKLAFEKLNEVDRKLVLEAANNADTRTIDDLIFKQLEKQLDDLSIRELRLVASKYHIPYYSTKMKQELIDAIRTKQSVDNANGESRGTGTKTT